MIDASGISWTHLRAQVEDFALKLHAALAALGIREACADLKIDHMCLRLKRNSDVDQLKLELSEAGEIISAVTVNGREILIIQLDDPFSIGPWRIPAVELPYPKPNHAYADGWEHVEFVLDGAENTLDGVRHTFAAKFPTLNMAELRDMYHYSEDMPEADADQIANPTLALKVNGVGLKFHAKSIQEVVGYSS
jgi:predicted metalloenzyme YecM